MPFGAYAAYKLSRKKEYSTSCNIPELSNIPKVKQNFFRSYGPSFIGGLIFGLGFGGLIGAFTFSMTYGYLKGLGLFDTMNLGKLTLFNISEKFPSVFQIGYAGLLIVGILFMLIAYIIPTTLKKN